MPRTTIDLEASILREVKDRARAEGKSMGQVLSELAATALANNNLDRDPARPFKWRSRRMGAKIDLEDKDELYKALGER